jgi:hypothetical protein
MRALLASLLLLSACTTAPERADEAKLTDAATRPDVAPSNTAAPAADDKLAGTYSESHPIMVVGERELVEEQVEDCLFVEPAEDGGLRFSFLLIQTNGQSCEMRGVARPGEAGSWVFEEEAAEGQIGCRMELRVTERAISLYDVDDGCKPMWCGANAEISQTDFARATREDGNSCSAE